MARLTPEQISKVSAWVAEGATLSQIQERLSTQLEVPMTYMDVRFLVDDLNLTLKDPAPKADASDVTKAPPAPAPAAAQNLPADEADSADAEAPEAPLGDDATPAAPAGPSSVTVVIDAVTLIPGAIAGGTVTFSDGVTGKWIIDQQYRPGFTEISQPGYRPSPADAQAFMQELGRAMQTRGF
jgi:hypothetical protein